MKGVRFGGQVPSHRESLRPDAARNSAVAEDVDSHDRRWTIGLVAPRDRGVTGPRGNTSGAVSGGAASGGAARLRAVHRVEQERSTRDETRTRIPRRVGDFESPASTDSATRAWVNTECNRGGLIPLSTCFLWCLARLGARRRHRCGDDAPGCRKWAIRAIPCDSGRFPAEFPPELTHRFSARTAFICWVGRPSRCLPKATTLTERTAALAQFACAQSPCRVCS